VDALISLAATFHPETFQMYWTTHDIAHLRLMHVTTIWEGCIKCYLPTAPVFYASLALLLIFRRPAQRLAQRLGACFLGA
jgi:hypothetical protein